MPKIADSKGRGDDNSAYIRLFGNVELGHLISKVQSTVIRTGNDLEDMIKKETSYQIQAVLDEILVGQNNLFKKPNIQVVFGAHIAGENGNRGVTADIVVFNHKKKEAKVIELKDGDTFDTKKSSGELESMKTFSEILSRKTKYKAEYYFCCFNQDDKQAIVAGAKRRFSIEHAMTGKELCALLGIDYDAFRLKRQGEQAENLDYFIGELIKIPEIRRLIEKMLKYPKKP